MNILKYKEKSALKKILILFFYKKKGGVANMKKNSSESYKIFKQKNSAYYQKIIK